MHTLMNISNAHADEERRNSNACRIVLCAIMGEKEIRLDGRGGWVGENHSDAGQCACLLLAVILDAECNRSGSNGL